MARITVEDCLKNVKNRFELVLVAAKRARDITRRGLQPLVDSENDKPTVVALREIAAGLVNASVLDDVAPVAGDHHANQTMDQIANDINQALLPNEINSQGALPEIVLKSDDAEAAIGAPMQPILLKAMNDDGVVK